MGPAAKQQVPTAALPCWCLQELFLAVPPVVPAAKGAATFSTEDFALFGSFVDGFSVMSYDYSTSLRGAGPNAPLWWLRDNLRKALAGHRHVLHHNLRSEGQAAHACCTRMLLQCAQHAGRARVCAAWWLLPTSQHGPCSQPQLASQTMQLKPGCWCRELSDKFLMGLNFYGELLWDMTLAAGSSRQRSHHKIEFGVTLMAPQGSLLL